MKRFLCAGERYGLFRLADSRVFLHHTPLNKQLLYTKTQRNGWLVPLWFPKVTGITLLVAFTCFLYRYCRDLVRLSVGNSSAPSRSPVEAQSKDCRSPLEQQSKPSRRSVEQIPKDGRTNLEETGVRFGVFATPVNKLFSGNFSGVRTSCIYLGLFFMCLQATIAKEPNPETDRAVLVAYDHPVFVAMDTTNTSTQEIPRISAGQRLPEEFWTTEFQFYDHEKVYTQTLEEYRGKPILLSFWMVYCGPCIASFPILNGFMAKYGEDLIVLPVNSVRSDSITIIDKRFSKLDNTYKIPSIIQDEYLKEVFPHVPIPHYIWIQPNGKVGAVTQQNFVNEVNLTNFVELYEKN